MTYTELSEHALLQIANLFIDYLEKEHGRDLAENAT
jgi:hypothetical protein